MRNKLITHINLLLALAFLFGLLLVGEAFAQEETESPAFAPILLEDGVPVEGEFEGMLTARLYGFDASAGDRVSVQMTGDLDSYIVLIGSGGEFIAYDDDGGEAFGDSLMEDVELPADGRYYVLATTYDFIDGIMLDSMELAFPLTYELIVEGFTAPENTDEFTVLDATPFELGETISRTLTAEQPIGLYTFEAAQGDILNVYADSESVMYLLVHVFGPDGGRIGLTHDTDDEPLTNLEALLDGPYVVMAMDAFFVDRLLPNAGDYGLGEVLISATAN